MQMPISISKFSFLFQDGTPTGKFGYYTPDMSGAQLQHSSTQQVEPAHSTISIKNFGATAEHFLEQ